MSHRQKVEHLIAELGQQGVGPYTVAPPLFRLLWALGLEVPPPLFLGFRKLSLLMGTFFGVVWGALWGVGMWFWAWQGDVPLGLAITMTAFAAMFAGLIFGLVMGWYMRWTSGRLDISASSWEEYPQA